MDIRFSTRTNAELVAALERAEARVAEEKARAERAETEAAEEKARNEGTYYSRCDDIWEAVEEQFDRNSLMAIQRKEPHPLYKDTTKFLTTTDELRPAYDSTRSKYDPGSSLESHTNDSQTAKTRKRRLESACVHNKSVTDGEIAHLIPHAQSCARFYGPMVVAATGCRQFIAEEDPTKKEKQEQVLIHGQYQPSHGQDNQAKKSRCESKSGLKHHRANMARVPLQKWYLDFIPSILMIPVLTLEQTLSYEKGAYNVLLICSTTEAYSRTSFRGEEDCSNEDELKTATGTLASFVKAAACTLASTSTEMIETKMSKIDREKILKSKAQIERTASVLVPKVKNNLKNSKWRLAKVTWDTRNEKSHQECDPFLLFTRAAVVWSSVQNQKLLPGCSMPHDCDECLAAGQFVCCCDAYDPSEPIPSEIVISPDDDARLLVDDDLGSPNDI